MKEQFLLKNFLFALTGLRNEISFLYSPFFTSVNQALARGS